MIKIASLKERLAKGEYEDAFAKNYGKEDLAAQSARHARVVSEFEKLFGPDLEVEVFSAPGRTEICGNHTDHNRGKVLAAGIDLDAAAVAGKSGGRIVRVKSEGFEAITVDLDDLGAKPSEKNESAALVRGVCAGFKNRGYKVGGFDAATASDVPKGLGMSSSAAFEILLGTIINEFFNDGRVSEIEIAQIAQFAENEYYGKPCGLMDQLTSSVGGLIAIDFKNPSYPEIKKIGFDFNARGYAPCIVNTGEEHSDLTRAYSSVRKEMEAVAGKLGKSVLREVDEKEFKRNVPFLRKTAGDRAVLRAVHFFNENRRVDAQVAALENGDFETFKKLVVESGRSSYMYNQNVYVGARRRRQPLAVALALCEDILGGAGAWRVHGGGFAGTVQAFVPFDLLGKFKDGIGSVFGGDSCYVLNIRPSGGARVIY